MIYLDRLMTAIRYREELKGKKEVADIKILYQDRPEDMKKEIDKYSISHKNETEILIKKIKYFFQDIQDKGMSDKIFFTVICPILSVLEPPNCQKSHCQYHTTAGFCNCSENRIPGKCREHMKYMDRKAKRENKTPGKYFPDPGSRVIITNVWRKEILGVIGKAEKKEGKWYFPFLMDGCEDKGEIDVCIDEIALIKNITGEH